MKMEFHRFNIDNIDTELFTSLQRHFLFQRGGVLRKIYNNPHLYSYSESLLGVTRDLNNKPISVCFIAKGHFFGWEYSGVDLKGCYGIIAFYTTPEHRKKGIATELFEKFDDEFRVRKICYACRAASMVKSLHEDEKCVFLGA